MEIITLRLWDYLPVPVTVKTERLKKKYNIKLVAPLKNYILGFYNNLQTVTLIYLHNMLSEVIVQLKFLILMDVIVDRLLFMPSNPF